MFMRRLDYLEVLFPVFVRIEISTKIIAQLKNFASFIIEDGVIYYRLM